MIIIDHHHHHHHHHHIHIHIHMGPKTTGYRGTTSPSVRPVFFGPGIVIRVAGLVPDLAAGCIARTDRHDVGNRGMDGIGAIGISWAFLAGADKAGVVEPSIWKLGEVIGLKFL